MRAGVLGGVCPRILDPIQLRLTNTFTGMRGRGHIIDSGRAWEGQMCCTPRAQCCCVVPSLVL